MTDQGPLARWIDTVSTRRPATSAGWWTADPLGVLGARWQERLGAAACVIDLDFTVAEAALGMPGPRAELARLLAGEKQIGASHRVVALHAQLLAEHGALLYVTRKPALLRPSVRDWLVTAGRAGGTTVLAVVRTRSSLPEDWWAGEYSPLVQLPQPCLDSRDLDLLFPPEERPEVPDFSVSAFLAACGGRVDTAELALAGLNPQQRRQALITGEAARRRAGSPLERSLSTVVLGLDDAARELLEKVSTSTTSLPLRGSDVETAIRLTDAGLLRTLAVNGRPQAGAISELVRASVLGGFAGTAEPAGGLAEWARRIDRANEAMDGDAGAEAAARLYGARERWSASPEADFYGALLVEQAFVERGPLESLRVMRSLDLDGPLIRAAIVRVSFETGQLHHTVAAWCRTYLGRTPSHRDDTVVLGLLPPSSLRRDYIKALSAAELGDLRVASVAFARLVREVHTPLPELTDADGQGLSQARVAFERRIYRVSAAQGLFMALALGGYRSQLLLAARAIARRARPWHGALAGVHELSVLVTDLHRGSSRRMEQQFGRAVGHAQIWRHASVEQMVTALSTSAWMSADLLGENVQGALIRGRFELEVNTIKAMLGDAEALSKLAGTTTHTDPRAAAAGAWARATLQVEDPVQVAYGLAESGDEFFVGWLVNASLMLDPDRMHPATQGLLTVLGQCSSHCVDSLDALRSLVKPLGLAVREAETERARLAGDDVRTTAAGMGLSERTIESYRAGARAKFQGLEELGFGAADARRWALELAEVEC